MCSLYILFCFYLIFFFLFFFLEIEIVFSSANCRAYGDPHFNTFDGLVHHYQGTEDEWLYVDECFQNHELGQSGVPFRIRGSHIS